MEKIVLITGVSKGIGKAIYTLFKENNYTTLGLTRTLEDSNVDTNLYFCELDKPSNIESVITEILDEYGKIDILINNAGAVSTTRFKDIGVSEWDYIFNVNVRAPYLLTKLCLPNMLKAKYGRIINISSIAGNSYSKSASCTYTSSKHALNGLTKQLVYEHSGSGVNFNIIAPSQTYTEMLTSNLTTDQIKTLEFNNPQGRLLKAEEVATMCHFLCQTECDYINGEIINMNGGTV
jgi:3-oxoacyl-[acyl-carrier protein] reductase